MLASGQRTMQMEEWPPLESAKVLGLLPPSKMDQGRQEIVDGKGLFCRDPPTPPPRRQAVPLLTIT